MLVSPLHKMNKPKHHERDHELNFAQVKNTLSTRPLCTQQSRLNGEFNRATEQYFQLSTEWRNHHGDDNHRVSERVTGPNKCFTNQILPAADQFLQSGLGVPSAAAIGSGGRRHGALTNGQRTRQREIAFAFFQSFEGSVRSDSSRRS